MTAVVIVGCDDYNKLMKSTDYDYKLQRADEYYDTKIYARAAELYEELIPIFRGTDKSERIYYRYAWSEFKIGDAILSQYHFKNFARQFPNSEHTEECYYMNAFCYYLNSPNYSLDQTYSRNAIKEFQSFIDLYPQSSRVDSCNAMIDILTAKIERKEYEIIKQYHKIYDYKAAAVAASNFIKEYPLSAYNEEMYWVIIDSYYSLALNSYPSKKKARIEAAIENYVKFASLYPKSSYLSRAEGIYNHCIRLKEKL